VPERNDFQIEADNVTYTYDSGSPPALRDIHLRIRRGEWIWVAGPSGAGKSTLLGLLSGLLLQEDGPGRKTGSVKVEGRAGIVFQDPEAGIVQLYVEDELAFGPENLCVAPAEIDRRVDDALMNVDLPEWRHRRTDELSGGQKQRIAIASMLTIEPDVLLLDEATASLDGQSSERLMAVLRKLHGQGKTIVFASTRLQMDAVSAADRLIVLDQGMISADGDAQGIMENRRSALEQLGCIIVDTQSALSFQEAVHDDVEPSAAPLLEVCGLTYGYHPKGSRKSTDIRTVLNDIHLSLKSGDFLALLGPNGTGKTTLGKLLAGVLTPPKGCIYVGGEDIRRDLDRGMPGKVGYVFQNPEHQFVADTVLEECILGLKMKRGLHIWQPTPTDLKDEGKRLLREAGFALEGLADAHPFQLPAGAKRMLSIVSAIVTEPDVLVLDEPTAGLDYRSAVAVMAMCASYAKRGKAVVMITHDAELARGWANRTYQLNFSTRT